MVFAQTNLLLKVTEVFILAISIAQMNGFWVIETKSPRK